MKITELFEKRKQAVADARTILERARSEGRELTAEENVQYDKHFADASRLADEMRREEELLKQDSDLARIEEELKKPETRAAYPQLGDPKVRDDHYKRFCAYLKPGSLSPTEERELFAGSNTQGGYLIGPEQFVAELLRGIRDAVGIEQRARVFTTSSIAGLGVPTLTTRPSKPKWTSELSAGDPDTTMALGKRALEPKQLAKEILVSNVLLMNSELPAEQIVRDELAAIFGETKEYAYLLGSGANEPLGMFVASEMGVPTSRDISSGANAGAGGVNFDGLKDAKGALKQGYRAGAVWIFHRDLVTKISKLKDNDGRYLWQDAVTLGEPDTISNIPVLESEFAPNTITQDSYVGMLANLNYYWIQNAKQFSILRINEVHYRRNMIAFAANLWADGQPVLPEAFVRLKVPA